MPGTDTFSQLIFSSSMWSADVTANAGDSSSGPQSIMVNSLSTSRVRLNGVIAAVGDTATATFTTPNGNQYSVQLSAVYDVSGATVFSDGSSLYVFASFQLSISRSYDIVDGFGHFTAPEAASASCLVCGTYLQTQAGEVAVERLRPGDVVLTATGALERIRWVGSHVVLPGRHSQRPVVIEANAFDEGEPRLRLLLSPNHAILRERHFIPVKHLINGSTVTWPPLEQSTTYHHLELKTQAAVYAQGLAVETFLNTSGRAAFTQQLFDADLRDVARACWTSMSFAPLAETGEVVRRVKQALDRRAARTLISDTRGSDVRVGFQELVVQSRRAQELNSSLLLQTDNNG